MPVTKSTKNDVISMRPTRAMQRQLADLIAAGYGNQTDVLRLAVERMHIVSLAGPYEVRVPLDAPSISVHFLATFAEARIAAMMYFACKDNRESVVSIYDNKRQLVAVYNGIGCHETVIDGVVWGNATYADDFNLDTWQGVTVNDTPCKPIKGATIVEGPRKYESDLTPQEFSLASLLDKPSVARDVDGFWYLFEFPAL
jgi:hypothetical protein